MVRRIKVNKKSQAVKPMSFNDACRKINSVFNTFMAKTFDKAHGRQPKNYIGYMRAVDFLMEWCENNNYCDDVLEKHRMKIYDAENPYIEYGDDGWKIIDDANGKILLTEGIMVGDDE